MPKIKVLLKVIVLTGLLLAAGTGIYFGIYPNSTRCFFVNFYEFERVAPGIYVTNDTPPEARNRLQDILKHAEKRVISFWGDKKGNPTLIYCHNPASLTSFGSGTPGVAYLNPFKSFVVIGPSGLRTDIISHELCHVELFERLGWLKSEFQKPAWFDEGLALMVDYRYSNREKKSRYFGYLIDWDRRITLGIPAIGLNELHTLQDFSEGNPQRKVFAYVTAGMEVSRWMEVVGVPGVHQLIDAIKEGESFKDAYAGVEEKKRSLAASPESPGSPEL